MLDFDYDLIPLAPAASEQVVRDARVLARRGRVPSLSAANAGRVVVVNPNQGYALNHVPDDLRKPLRRVMLPVQEGSRPIPPGRMLEIIEEGSDEPLHVVIVEAHSEYPGLSEFVRALPLLAKRHPKCQFILHAEMPMLYELLEAQLSQPGAFCDLYFDHEGEPLRITGTEVLGRMLVDLPRYPTFGTPFFSELRVCVGEQSNWFNLDQMKRLYRMFGVGNVDELDISGKLREKLIVVDLPLSAIEAIRFSGNPGEPFHAVGLTDGTEILGEQFGDNGFSGRDVPIDEIKYVIRRLPGKKDEEISMSRVRGLRINCFAGHVSFLWQPTEQYLPLYELKGLRIGWPPHSPDGHVPDVRELAERDQIMRFNGVVPTEESRPRFGDIRANVRYGYLGTLYRENLERQAKLLEFSGRLNVACLGPLAGQTIKLLKSRGLGKVIPQDTTYYLSDTLDSLESYKDFRNQLRTSYDEITKELRALFPPEGGEGIQPDAITHRMPVVLEWIQGAPPPFDRVTAPQLETVFKEMQAYVKFCESEFLHLEISESESALSFHTLFQAQFTALRAKQLANLLAGNYGEFFTDGATPDFVFFGTEREFQANARQYYLPGISWAGVFKDPDIQGLFEENDFEFSVFLEEQLSIMTYLRSQEAPADAEGFDERYFRSRYEEVREELRTLRGRIGLKNDDTSEEFQRLTKDFEVMHREEVESFTEEGRQVAENLIDQESEYFTALSLVTRYFGDERLSPEALLEGGDYIELLDKQMVERSHEVLEKFREVLMRTAEQANSFLKQKLPLLKTYLVNLRNARKTQFDLLRAEFLHGLKEAYGKASLAVVEELQDLQHKGRDELIELESNLRKRRMADKGELDDYKLRMNRQANESQKEITGLRESVRGIAKTITAPLRLATGDGEEIALVGRMNERMDRAEEDIDKIIGTQKATRQSMDTFRLLYRRQRERMIDLFNAGNQLLLLEQMQEPTMAKVAMSQTLDRPLLAVPPIPDAESAEDLQAQLRDHNRLLAELGVQLSDFSLKNSFLEDSGQNLREFQEFQEINTQFQQAVTRKRMSQRAVITINNRLEKLKDEAENLPELIKKRMMPAYRVINESVFIPNAEKRIKHFQRALAFVKELEQLSFDDLRRDFMERSIFRRFHAAQFCRGAYFGMNPEMPLFHKLTNVFPGLANFHAGLRLSMPKQGYTPGMIVLEKLPSATAGGIIEYCQKLKGEPADTRYNYLVLPGTLSLPQALDIIHNKEEIFLGLPQLLLVYISKFDSRAVRDDEELRERYFRAIRHNVIINMNRGSVVDNPESIARALIDETLGCAHDFPLEQISLAVPAVSKDRAV